MNRSKSIGEQVKKHEKKHQMAQSQSNLIKVQVLVAILFLLSNFPTCPAQTGRVRREEESSDRVGSGFQDCGFLIRNHDQSKCEISNAPICGSDGQHYPSLCDLNIQACLRNVSLGQRSGDFCDIEHNRLASQRASSIKLIKLKGECNLQELERFKVLLLAKTRGIGDLFQRLDRNGDRVIEAHELWPQVEPIEAGSPIADSLGWDADDGPVELALDLRAPKQQQQQQSNQLRYAQLWTGTCPRHWTHCWRLIDYPFEPLFGPRGANPCSLSHLYLYAKPSLPPSGLDLHSFGRLFQSSDDGPKYNNNNNEQLPSGADDGQNNNNLQDPHHNLQRQQQQETIVSVRLGESKTLWCNLQQIQASTNGQDPSEISSHQEPKQEVTGLGPDGPTRTSEVCWWSRHLADPLAGSLRADPHVRLAANGSQLLIRDAQLYNSGPFKCQCNTDHSSAHHKVNLERKFQLQVLASPRVQVEPAKLLSMEGSRAKLECLYDFIDTRAFSQEMMTGFLVPQSLAGSSGLASSRTLEGQALFGLTLAWSHPADASTSTDRYKLTMQASRLNIEPVRATDQGQHSCRVRVAQQQQPTTHQSDRSTSAPGIWSEGARAHMSVISRPGQSSGLTRPMAGSQLASSSSSSWQADDESNEVDGENDELHVDADDDDVDDDVEVDPMMMAGKGQELDDEPLNLWLFHEDGISVYRLRQDDGSDGELELVRELNGHSMISSQVDGNWNQLTLCGGLTPDQAVICEWSDNALGLANIDRISSGGQKYEGLARKLEVGKMQQQQQQQDSGSSPNRPEVIKDDERMNADADEYSEIAEENSEEGIGTKRKNHHPRKAAESQQTITSRRRRRRRRREQESTKPSARSLPSRRYVYVGQPNLNRIVVMDARELEIVAIIQTEPQPRRLHLVKPNRVHLSKWIRRRLSPGRLGRLTNNDDRNSRSSVGLGHGRTQDDLAANFDDSSGKSSSSRKLSQPMGQFKATSDYDNHPDSAGDSTTASNYNNNNLIQFDIWLLCYGQPLVLDPSLEVASEILPGSVSDPSSSVGQQQQQEAEIEANRYNNNNNNSANTLSGASTSASSFRSRGVEAGSRLGRALDADKRLPDWPFAWPPFLNPGPLLAALQGGASSSGKGASTLGTTNEHSGQQRPTGSGSAINDKESRLRNRKSVHIVQSTFLPRPVSQARQSHSMAATDELLELDSESPSHHSTSRSSSQDPVTNFRHSTIISTHHIYAGQAAAGQARGGGSQASSLMQNYANAQLPVQDLIQDLAVPERPKALEEEPGHKSHFAYVSHYNEQRLFRVSMDDYRYEREIDLQNCDPIRLTPTALGLLIVQCRSPISHQLTGQLVLDELTSSPIEFNANIKAQETYLSPDHRYLISVYTNPKMQTGKKPEDQEHRPNFADANQINGRPASGSQSSSSSSTSNSVIYVQTLSTRGAKFQYEIKTSTLDISDCSFVWRDGYYAAIFVSTNLRDQETEILSLRLADGRLELIARLPGIISAHHRHRQQLTVAARVRLAALSTDRGTFIVDLEENRISQTLRQHQTPPTLLWL